MIPLQNNCILVPSMSYWEGMILVTFTVDHSWFCFYTSFFPNTVPDVHVIFGAVQLCFQFDLEI